MLVRSYPVREVDRLTARIFDSATRTSGARLDAYRDGDSFVIDIDLPGVDPDSIDVTVDRTVLTIRAERRRVEREGVRMVVSERPMGTFTRRVVLSDTLDVDHLVATYDAGVLTLTIPVAETAKPRKIEITSAADRELVDA